MSTPRSILNATPTRTLMIRTPRTTGRSPFVLPEQMRIVPSASKEKPEPIKYSGIKIKSFYTTSPDEKDDATKFKSPVAATAGSGLASTKTKASSEPRRPATAGPSRRSSSFKKTRKSLTGLKRKRDGMTNKGGFGHAIKRPKKKRRVDIKISQIPAMSIEIPGSKNAATATPKTPASAKAAKAPVTPKTGNFALSAETCVNYEVKGGQIIYRKGNTPLRRSPRKHQMSPLKQSYFEGAKRKARGSSKLFSPQAVFLEPEQASPQKHVPSPVKFSVSTDDVRK